jgi:hypothetical protein
MYHTPTHRSQTGPLGAGYGTVSGMTTYNGYNNNNDALLSQTWVIAIVAVLRVRTVPYVEPHNVQGELDPCYSYSCCGRVASTNFHMQYWTNP